MKEKGPAVAGPFLLTYSRQFRYKLSVLLLRLVFMVDGCNHGDDTKYDRDQKPNPHAGAACTIENCSGTFP